MTTETVDDMVVIAKPFGFKDKIGYMFGDFGNNTLIALVNFLFLKFYTDVMNVPAALVARRLRERYGWRPEVGFTDGVSQLAVALTTS